MADGDKVRMAKTLAGWKKKGRFDGKDFASVCDLPQVEEGEVKARSKSTGGGEYVKNFNTNVIADGTTSFNARIGFRPMEV